MNPFSDFVHFPSCVSQPREEIYGILRSGCAVWTPPRTQLGHARKLMACFCIECDRQWQHDAGDIRLSRSLNTRVSSTSSGPFKCSGHLFTFWKYLYFPRSFFIFTEIVNQAYFKKIKQFEQSWGRGSFLTHKLRISFREQRVYSYSFIFDYGLPVC